MTDGRLDDDGGETCSEEELAVPKRTVTEEARELLQLAARIE